MASAAGTIQMDPDEAREAMREILRQMGEWVDSKGGIIGHIKCSLKMETVVGLSITYDEVQENISQSKGIPLSFASIAFGVDPDEMAEKVAALLDGIIA